MPNDADTLSGRLPLIDPAERTHAQRALVDHVKTAFMPRATFQTMTAGGRLIGPFDPALLLRAPYSTFNCAPPTSSIRRYQKPSAKW